MKKAFKLWAGFSLLAVFLTAVTNWANHPLLVSRLNGNVVNVLYLLVPVMLLGWVLRAKVLRLSTPWADHFSAVFLLAFLVPFFFPKVHSSNEASVVMWSMTAASSLCVA